MDCELFSGYPERGANNTEVTAADISIKINNSDKGIEFLNAYTEAYLEKKSRPQKISLLQIPLNILSMNSLILKIP